MDRNTFFKRMLGGVIWVMGISFVTKAKEEKKNYIDVVDDLGKEYKLFYFGTRTLNSFFIEETPKVEVFVTSSNKLYMFLSYTFKPVFINGYDTVDIKTGRLMPGYPHLSLNENLWFKEDLIPIDKRPKGYNPLYTYPVGFNKDKNYRLDLVNSFVN